MEINECGKTGGASCGRNWCEMGRLEMGTSVVASLVSQRSDLSRLNGASRPFEQAFELVGRNPRAEEPDANQECWKATRGYERPANTRQRLSTSVRQRGGNRVDIILLRAAGRLCRAADITCTQSVETFQINLLRYVMNLVLEYSSVTAVSLS
jgi:hypothetical protein